MATKKKTAVKKPAKKKTTKKQCGVVRGKAALKGDKTIYND